MDEKALIQKLKELKSMDRNEAVSILHQYAASEAEPKLLTHIVKEIGKYKDLNSVPVLIELLTRGKSDELFSVRSMATNILGNMKDERAIVPLMYVMNDKEEGYRIRLGAADALGKIGHSTAVNPLINIVSDEEEKSMYLKESAAKALGMIGDERAVDSLIQIVETKKGVFDKFNYLKERAIEALGKLGYKKESRIQALKNVLNDASEQVRASAVDALSEIDDEDVTELIAPMIYDKSEDVAKTAIYALYCREGREHIIQLLEEPDLPQACREEIMEILEEEEQEEDD